MRKNISPWPWVLALIVAITGIVLSFALWNARISLEHQALETSFLADALRVKDAIAQEITLTIDVLDSIRQLHAISDQITAEDFGEFVEKGMVYQKRILGAFGFAQRMDHYTRRLLEQSESLESGPSLQIVERASSGEWVPAETRPEYIPLTYQTPQDGLRIPNGFDFISVASYRNAVAAMSRSGSTVIGGRATTEDPMQPAESYLLFSPILYEKIQNIPIQPPGYLVGFTIAFFQPDLILKRAQESLAFQGFDVHLLPPGSKPEKTLEKNVSQNALNYVDTVQVADQSWVLRCRAGEDYLRAQASRQPALILWSGLLITSLLTMELLLLAGRAQRTEKTIRLRTSALQEAKSLLEQEMAQRARLESEILDISNREKLRVGQDLHDSLGQKLTAAAFLSRALAQKKEIQNSAVGDEAEKINALLKETVTQVRRLARGLAPVELGDAGLGDALRRLAADAEEAYGISCVFHADGKPETLPSKTAVQLYHVAQEALTNAARHGKPSHVAIRLTLQGRNGELAVEDDGAGLPKDAEGNRGMGLQIMRYRATMIGGSLEIKNRTRGGTEVICRFGFSSRETSGI